MMSSELEPSFSSWNMSLNFPPSCLRALRVSRQAEFTRGASSSERSCLSISCHTGLCHRDQVHRSRRVPSHDLYSARGEDSQVVGATIMREPLSPLDAGIRKRVHKACDRCRLKKSKCESSSPCSRCKADNAICVSGERKKYRDRPTLKAT
ncbi:hypothetical protein PV05_09900, partial [Exophiala xenobiotica]